MTDPNGNQANHLYYALNNKKYYTYFAYGSLIEWREQDVVGHNGYTYISLTNKANRLTYTTLSGADSPEYEYAAGITAKYTHITQADYEANNNG